MAKKRRWKMSAADRKASYKLRAEKRAATMARKEKGKAILAKAPTPRADALRKRVTPWAQIKRNNSAVVPVTDAERASLVGASVEPEPVDVAVRRVIDSMAQYADLDIVIYELRAKVQGIADERPPSDKTLADEVVLHLSHALRASRFMRINWGVGRDKGIACPTTTPA